MSELTTLQKEAIVKRYSEDVTVNCAGLAREYSVGRWRVWKILTDKGIKVRDNISGKRATYSINENFFETIDTEEKAYFLGLLYADGYADPKRKLIGITLQEEDKELLEKLRIILKYTKPLTFKKPKQLNRKSVYILDIYRIKIYKDVVRLGCVPTKSLILKFPTEEQVPKHLLRHFVRGYFDGDGHISNHASITSSDIFIDALKKLFSNMDIEYKVYSMRCNSITKNMCLYKCKSTLRFCEWIYKDANIYMKRKYDKYIIFKESRPNLVN